MQCVLLTCRHAQVSKATFLRARPAHCAAFDVHCAAQCVCTRCRNTTWALSAFYKICCAILVRVQRPDGTQHESSIARAVAVEDVLDPVSTGTVERGGTVYATSQHLNMRDVHPLASPHSLETAAASHSSRRGAVQLADVELDKQAVKVRQETDPAAHRACMMGTCEHPECGPERALQRMLEPFGAFCPAASLTSRTTLAAVAHCTGNTAAQGDEMHSVTVAVPEWTTQTVPKSGPMRPAYERLGEHAADLGRQAVSGAAERFASSAQVFSASLDEHFGRPENKNPAATDAKPRLPAAFQTSFDLCSSALEALTVGGREPVDAAESDSFRYIQACSPSVHAYRHVFILSSVSDWSLLYTSSASQLLLCASRWLGNVYCVRVYGSRLAAVPSMTSTVTDVALPAPNSPPCQPSCEFPDDDNGIQQVEPATLGHRATSGSFACLDKVPAPAGGDARS